jgi:hypothetical protein
MVEGQEGHEEEKVTEYVTQSQLSKDFWRKDEEDIDNS